MAGPRKMKVWLERDENGQLPEIDEKKRERLTTRAFNYCVWALTQSAKTSKQLSDKMREKGCPEDILEATLVKLSSYGYLNDSEFAESFTSSKRSAGWGTRRIEMELRKRGVPDDDIAAATETEGWGGETEEDRAREFAEKKARSIPRNLDRKKRSNRLVGAMVRRGFSMDLAFQLSNELIVDDEEEE